MHAQNGLPFYRITFPIFRWIHVSQAIIEIVDVWKNHMKNENFFLVPLSIWQKYISKNEKRQYFDYEGQQFIILSSFCEIGHLFYGHHSKLVAAVGSLWVTSIHRGYLS